MNERILAGRYRLIDAVGGRSDLFHGVDESLRRKVAVKRLPEMPGANRQYWEGEIAKAAGLHDPSLLAIYDVVIEGDSIYLITEDLDGDILSLWVREQAPLRAEVAIDLLRQLTGAVVQAEKNGLRDIVIDASSVLVTREGFVKVIAYGPLLAGDRPRITQAEMVHQAGILLYEMLTGEKYSELVPRRQMEDDVQIALQKANVEHAWLPDRIQLMMQRSFGGDERSYATMQDFYKDVKAVHHAIGQRIEVEERLANLPSQTPSTPHSEQPAATDLSASALAEKAASAASASLAKASESLSRLASRSKNAAKKQAAKAPQDDMEKTQQMRVMERVHQITEENRAKKRKPPLTYLWTVVVLLVVCGGLWYTLSDKTDASVNASHQVKGKQVKMPNLMNKTADQATQILTDSGFSSDSIQWVYLPSDDEATKGKIVSQSLDPNTQVMTSEQVILTVNAEGGQGGTAASGSGNAGNSNAGVGSTGGAITNVPKGTVPDLRGASQEQAAQTLMALGYRYSFVIQKGDTPSGTVSSQNPAAGTQAPAGTRVTFVVSQ